MKHLGDITKINGADVALVNVVTNDESIVSISQMREQSEKY